MSEGESHAGPNATGARRRQEEDTCRLRDGHETDDDIDQALDADDKEDIVLHQAKNDSDVDHGHKDGEEDNKKRDVVRSGVVLIWTVVGLVVLYMASGLLEQWREVLEGREWTWRGYQRISEGGRGGVRGLYT